MLRASKFGALELMQSNDLSERVLALKRMVMEDLTLEERPTLEEIPGVLEIVMNELADQIARRSVEDEIEKENFTKNGRSTPGFCQRNPNAGS